jgi:ABC-type transporter Mla maintaining outer membrane lipid asymmetry ATPase subunit MlaF
VALLYDTRVRFEGTVDEFRTSDDPIVRRFVSPSSEAAGIS